MKSEKSELKWRNFKPQYQEKIQSLEAELQLYKEHVRMAIQT